MKRVHEDAIAIIPSDTDAVLSKYGKENSVHGLYVGTGGDVTLDTYSSKEIVFKNVPSGTTIDLEVIKVHATNTTATDIMGFL